MPPNGAPDSMMLFTITRMSNILLTSLLVVIALTSLSSCSSDESCPTWLYHSEEGWCTCGNSLLNVILCNNETQDVSILSPFCLTSWDSKTDPDKAVVGGCLYGQHNETTGSKAKVYIKVNQNLSKQDQELCGYLNRKGRFCGVCKPNHFVSVYSYDFKCYKCSGNFLSNFVAYLSVAYIPLTVFLIIVMAFHISVASPHLHMAVLVCQIFTLPEIQRVLVQNTRDAKSSIPIKLLGSIYGVWNLDFFRSFIPPICLPLNTMQVIALDYLLALYPLLILVGFYMLVLARDKGYKIALKLWRPFLRCSARVRHEWNVKHSIIDAFATFLILSYMKFLNTSIDLMIPTYATDIHGSGMGYFFYYNATVEFMGPEHLPYAILAITVLAIGLIFPLMLLLYPMKWFQKLLNISHVNSPSLRAFMECFQGNYRDKSDGGWECRYFSAVYPLFRIGTSLTYALTRNDFFMLLEILMSLGVITVLQVFHPYKKQCNKYRTLDTLFLMCVIGGIVSIVLHDKPEDWYHTCNEVCPTLGLTAAAAFTFAPLFYFVTLLWKQMKLRWQDKVCCQTNRKCSEELNVTQPLIFTSTTSSASIGD